MKVRNHSRFDLHAVKELAGDKAYARGEPYYRDGLVTILSLQRGRVVAQVAGTEDYRTELTGGGTAIDGSCTCRAFEDYGFCKHMVATALAANAAGDSGSNDGIDALGRIRDHLKSKGIEALVDMIADMAERDPVLLRKLDLAATAVRADDKTLEARLRKAVDSATRTRGYVEYAEASGWADGVDEVLDSLGNLIPAGRAALALKLAEHAIDRIEKAVETIDDSDGHGGALLERARDIHLAACTAARPDPVQLARYLFGRQVHEVYDTFYDAVGLYADVLGEQGLNEYRRLAEAAWHKLPARMGRGKTATDDAGAGRQRVMAILDFFAERDGDVEVRIALRAKDLSSPWRYLQLAQFCLDEGREEEALRRAEEGMWIFEDDERPDQGLTLLVAELLAKKGRKEEAAAHLWRIFEKDPSLELYKRLSRLDGAAARTRAIGFLETKSAARKRPARDHWGWNSPGDLLIAILTHDKAFNEAWAAVRKHGATIGTQEALAKASERTHANQALAVYAARVEQLAGGGVYEEAVKLIARMGKLRDGATQAAYVADIKERHRRKRNFMKLLP